MANKLVETDLAPADGYVTPTSRYAESEIIYYGENNLMTFKIYKRKVIGSNSEDKFTVIPAGLEYRPDLMSQRIYGVVDFWWKIMEANGIHDIFDFKAGRNIRLPGRVF
jgi:hypothetical protein